MSDGSSLTLGETIEEIRCALHDYIEATYHIGHPGIIAQRRELLATEGITYREPYIESTPRYESGQGFADLSLPDLARDLLVRLASAPADESPLLHDPPYSHQAAALEAASRGFSLVVTTGTGSGKTESFLLPILSKLVLEAGLRPESFRKPAVRALLLYPMNALVNDQLGRLRLLFGDERVTATFIGLADRPARFARYTSRTLYPGVRSPKKDSVRLKAIGDFYVRLLTDSEAEPSPRQEAAQRLVANLKRRGKWPAKVDLAEWFGRSGQRWQNRNGDFVRAIAHPKDPELLTRHEVLAAPPDILVTNYSMLEYMMMRPLERPVFDATRSWLHENGDERFLLVVDEGHLYRGAAGAEVGLLIRRLRERLGIDPDRLQVICTSASFHNPEYAKVFAAQLTGKSPDDFLTLTGDLALRPNEERGTEDDAQVLAGVPLSGFYESNHDPTQFSAVQRFLDFRGVAAEGAVGRALFEALRDYAPMNLLVNLTMKGARPLGELATEVFDVEPDLAARALTALIALGSVARPSEAAPGLLPCRVHAFFRGLPGLWACLDPECCALEEELRGGPIGKLFGQPQATCDCGSRVFELFTCRNCGSAYGRAYTDNLEDPTFLWSEPGGGFLSVTGPVDELDPLDMLLEPPTAANVEPADLDLITGRLNPAMLGERTRQVFIRADREMGSGSEGGEGTRRDFDGQFRPCGVCGESAYGGSSVQDHQTKGDQPFQALITRQIQVQPPSPQAYSEFAPLRGRKVLAFSDSRQMAARLAPNLQTYSMQDALRPIALRGWRELSKVEVLAPSLCLDDLFLASLMGARLMSVRLRPELRGTESLHVMRDVDAAVSSGAIAEPAEMLQLVRTVGAEQPPVSLLRGIVNLITHRYYGLQSLALASIRERANLESMVDDLPDLPGVASTRDQKLQLLRIWLSAWTAPTAGIWFQGMNQGWWQTNRGVRPHSGKFASMERWIGATEPKRVFAREWLPVLLDTFCESVAPDKYRIRAGTLALAVGGRWAYCTSCRTTQRRFPGSDRCANCARDSVATIDPESDRVFSARKGYYRASSVRALADPPEPPLSIIASEHTAQLNAAQSDEVFSKAEEHELLFQDVDLGVPRPGAQRHTAIDVLSCTTTMEVGIDIGTLSGVALRNMPPSRASYQQRSGRAGRRGNAVATVIAFGSADSHDEHYFLEPDSMIRGSVDDPTLTLDNAEIAMRHVAAFLLQSYHQARLPHVDPEDQPQLFEVLGTVEDFLDDTAPLNRGDFEAWMNEHRTELIEAVGQWIPAELNLQDRTELLNSMVEQTLASVDEATGTVGSTEGDSETAVAERRSSDSEDVDATVVDAPDETGEERRNPGRVSENLLDRLLYKGVLPRYAFPTDVVSFYVFDRDRSTRFRPEFQYAPSQGLPVALSQYAPGKEVWIDGKLWSSGALYSPMSQDRFQAWQARRLYFECQVCRYASTETYQEADRGEIRDCPACGAEGKFGGAKNWIRPTGFAHPVSREEGTSPDDQPARSYATRAKLVAAGPVDPTAWQQTTDRIRQYSDRTHLLVTNSGPRHEGYSYCTRCGVIEPTAVPTGRIAGEHPKPYPDDREPTCGGGASTRGMVLGTDFISDVLLVSIRVDRPLTLQPGYLATEVALRTLSEALTVAGTRMLEIEAGELQAEFRPALTQSGHEGLEAEIYLYDTLAGGAGFARRVGEAGVRLFQEALRVLEGCPAGCDRSCYRCLRSFKNRFEHDLLDRHLGASLLRYLIHGTDPALGKERIEAATDRLFADLQRLGLDGVTFERNALIKLPGIGATETPILATTQDRQVIVGVHGPLTPDHTTDEQLREAKEYGTTVPVVLVDEIVVSRNLPTASQRVVEALA